MHIKEYLKAEKKTARAFAEECGLSHAYIVQIGNGTRRPAADAALRIERATGGAVTVLELLYPDRPEHPVEAEAI